MAKLKISSLPDNKTVKLMVEVPASVHRDFQIYAEMLGRESGQAPDNLGKLVVAMVERFMATDRAFVKSRKLG